MLRPTGLAHRNFVPGFIVSIFVIFALLVMLLPGGTFDGIAQAQPSPSPSGPRIQFLNPSGTTDDAATAGPGREVSTKSDNSDANYHLVAWVNQVPSNPTVEFKLQSGTTESTISTGTLRGTDTFDAPWNASSLSDGNYTVKAILYSNGVEVARDEEAVEVNNADSTRQQVTMLPTGEDTGETVEIVYPTNAGPWGAFRKSGSNDPYVGVVDVTTSNGTTEVRAFYTTSAPGTEPVWTRCSAPDAGEAVADAGNGVRCTLAVGTNPTSVTAISAAAGDVNQEFPGDCTPTDDCGEGEDSGDAHRAFGYVQTPTTVSVAPATQRKDDTPASPAGNQYPCSDVITATVLDQNARKVASANVDVHAALPTDNLHFDSSNSAESTNHQPPNSGGHTTENTVDCESTATPKAFNTTAGEAQGEHEVIGEGDVKHIEAAATGTDDAGQFKTRLLNRNETITGTTQFTAFYDRDDDDRYCSAEPAGHGSIGWGADPITPTGVPSETGTCPEPSPTGSTTASPSGSPTASRSATGSPTGSPTPGTSRTVTLAASDAKVRSGANVTLNGQVFSSAASCEDGEFIRIRRRVHGTDTFSDFGSATTDTEGIYETTIKAKVSADYLAVATAHDNCAEATSESVTVLAQVKVSIKVNDFTPERGTNIVFKGKVTPNHKGTKVTLQRKKGGRWVKVAKDELNGRSRYVITIEADWAKARRFRVKWPGADSDHESGKSQVVKVRAHN